MSSNGEEKTTATVAPTELEREIFGAPGEPSESEVAEEEEEEKFEEESRSRKRQPTGKSRSKKTDTEPETSGKPQVSHICLSLPLFIFRQIKSPRLERILMKPWRRSKQPDGEEIKFLTLENQSYKHNISTAFKQVNPSTPLRIWMTLP